MTAAATMLVQLRELPASRVIELSNDFIRDAIGEMPTRAILGLPDSDPGVGGAEANVEIYADDDANVYARGKLNGWFTLGCSRCIEPAKVSFAETLHVTFRLAGTIPGDAGDAAEPEDDLGLEVSDDDLDLYTYEGETIDLEPLLREQLVLAVPFAPLCSEECKGLCPRCGADKNLDPCSCEPPIDPRLAALQNIKL